MPAWKQFLTSLVEDLRGEHRCREFSSEEMMAAYARVAPAKVEKTQRSEEAKLAQGRDEAQAS